VIVEDLAGQIGGFVPLACTSVTRGARRTERAGYFVTCAGGCLVPA
jgi:hypothetical protein